MKSYVTITQDRKTGEVEVSAKLLPSEKSALLYIRHFIVEHITRIIEPEVKKVIFKLVE